MTKLKEKFEKVFEVDLDNIKEGQWFTLSYIVFGKIRGMCVANSIEEFKEVILSELIHWYNEYINSTFDYEKEWAYKTKEEIQNCLKEN